MQITSQVKAILANYRSDNLGTNGNLARILMEGKLSGTGKLVILPVDQGFDCGRRVTGTLPSQPRRPPRLAPRHPGDHPAARIAEDAEARKQACTTARQAADHAARAADDPRAAFEEARTATLEVLQAANASTEKHTRSTIRPARISHGYRVPKS